MDFRRLSVWDGIALLGLAAGLFGVLATLVGYYGYELQYLDRFLIVGAVLWVGWQSLRSDPLPAARPFTFFGYFTLVVGCIFYPLAWFLAVRVNGGRSALIWWETVALELAVVGWCLVRSGWPLVRRLLFPLVFFLFALPLPSTMLAPLQILLQNVATSGAEFILRGVGIAVERSGFVLRLPNGDLGVAEACSGVRSLTALTALAAFVAHRRKFGPLRGVLLVLLAIPVVAAANVVRIALSGVIQEKFGDEYIRGAWHEGLGVVMVLLGLAVIVQLAKWIGPKVVTDAPIDAPAEPGSPNEEVGRKHIFAAVLLSLSAVATLAVILSAGRVQAETGVTAPLEDMSPTIGNWTSGPNDVIPVPHEVTEMLGEDRSVHRVYTNNLGQQIHVWVVFWSSANLVKGYHHPDVCWPNRGFKVIDKRTELVEPAGCGEVWLTVREFASETQVRSQRQLILYWTQDGGHIWTDGDERKAQAGVGGNWVADLLRPTADRQSDGRLVVLIGTDDVSAVSKKETARFARLFAEELYRLCPWATPPRN